MLQKEEAGGWVCTFSSELFGFRWLTTISAKMGRSMTKLYVKCQLHNIEFASWGENAIDSEQFGFHFENKLSRCSCCPMPMMKEQWSEMVWSKFIAGLVSRPRLIESDGLPNIPLCSTKHCQFLTSVAKTCWFKANIKLTQIIYLNHQLHHCLHDQPKSKKKQLLVWNSNSCQNYWRVYFAKTCISLAHFLAQGDVYFDKTHILPPIKSSN